MSGFRLGTIFGFEIHVDLSWFIILFLIIWSFSFAVFPAQVPGLTRTVYLLMGGAGAILFFASLLAHELSHALVAERKGIEVEGITLFVFGGVARTKSEARTPGDEFQIAGVGPLTSFLAGALIQGAGVLAARLGAGLPVVVVLEYLALLNYVLAVFNLLPGFPLDGGRVFRSIVWKFTGNLDRATRIATTGGRWLGWGLAGLGLLQVFNGLTISGLWLVFIGWYLRNAAVTSYQQHRIHDVLAGVHAVQTMSPSPETVPADMPLSRLMDDVFMRSRFVAFPVVDQDTPIGLVTLQQLREVPRESRPSITVREVMLPLDGPLVVDPEENMVVVMDRLRASPARRVLVMRDGRLVGIITASDVAHWLEKARQLDDVRA